MLANLEVPLTTNKYPTTRKTVAELKARTQFILKANPQHAQWIKLAGIDMVTLANNHAMDYGFAGVRQMTKLLSGKGIAFAGAGAQGEDAMKIATFRLMDGTRVGLFSAMAFVGRAALLKTTPATITTPGINVLNFNAKIDKVAVQRISNIVAAARKQCDFLIIGLHWGVERETIPTAYQVALGRAFADAGANVIWGNHPHVLQGAEVYKGVPIVYSMGNLISPTNALTGVVHLRIKDKKAMRIFFQPAMVRGGRVSALEDLDGRELRGHYINLCRALLKKFPNKDSRPAVTQ